MLGAMHINDSELCTASIVTCSEGSWCSAEAAEVGDKGCSELSSRSMLATGPSCFPKAGIGLAQQGSCDAWAYTPASINESLQQQLMKIVHENRKVLGKRLAVAKAFHSVWVCSESLQHVRACVIARAAQNLEPLEIQTSFLDTIRSYGYVCIR